MKRRAVNYQSDHVRLNLAPLTAQLVMTHEDYRLSGTINGSEVIKENREAGQLISNQAGDFRLEL